MHALDVVLEDLVDHRSTRSSSSSWSSPRPLPCKRPVGSTGLAGLRRVTDHRGQPERITLVAPLVSFLFTVGAGTSNIYFRRSSRSSTEPPTATVTRDQRLLGDGGLALIDRDEYCRPSGRTPVGHRQRATSVNAADPIVDGRSAAGS